MKFLDLPSCNDILNSISWNEQFLAQALMPLMDATVLALFGQLVVKLILFIQTVSYSSEDHVYLAGLFDFCQKDPKTETN